MGNDCGLETTERAYALALSGRFKTVAELVAQLKNEGHRTVLTDLRSRIFRRELRGLCARSTLKYAA